jgi:hypothetical protein
MKSLAEAQAQAQLDMSAKTAAIAIAAAVAAVGVESNTAPPTATTTAAASPITVPLIIGPEGCCNSCGVPFFSSRTLDPNSMEQFDLDLQTEAKNDIVWCPQCSSKYHARCTGVTYSPYVFIAEEESDSFACQKCLDKRQASLEFDTHLGPSSQALSLISQVRSPPPYAIHMLYGLHALHTPNALHTLYGLRAPHAPYVLLRLRSGVIGHV